MIEGWEIKKLEDCISFIKNGANIKQSKNAAGYPITRIETLSGGKFNRDKMGYADIFDLTRYSGYILNDGDVLMSHINSKTYVGRSVVYDKREGETIIHGMNLLRIITTQEVKPQYLYLFTLSHRFKKQIASIRKDAVNQSSVAIGDLKKLLVPVPSPQGQEKIVAELDCLTGIIEKKKQQIEELNKLAQSIFYDMFGDPITNERGWDVKVLGDEFSVASGGTPSTKENAYWDNGTIPWIGSNMCHNEVIYKNDGKFITEAGLNHSSARLFRKGFVLVALVGATIGKVALIEFDTTTNQNIAGIDVPANKSFTSYFVFYLIQSLYCLFESIGEGKFKMANLSFVRSLPLITPPLDLQTEFAHKIEAIEKQKELVKQSIVETETLFNSRMDYWFNN